MSALQPRAWAEHDRVARVDRSTPNWQWQLGTVTGLDGPRWVVVRWDDESPLDSYVSYVGAGDANLIREDDVPIDERWWLAPKLRDQLVRQEAAERLRRFAHALLPLDGIAWARLGEIARDLDHTLLVHDGLAAASRALLTPAPTPARTP